jgi:hypothetical protein
MGVNGKLNRNGTDPPHCASDPVKINEPLMNRGKIKIILKKSRLPPCPLGWRGALWRFLSLF